MKRQLKKLATSLVGASVLGTFFLGASVATSSVSSSAIASENVASTNSIELASGRAYEVMRITCPTNRYTYVISIAADDTDYYYRSDGLTLSTPIRTARNDPNAFHFYNDGFEYEVIPVRQRGNRGTATINVYKYTERLMSLRSCDVAYTR